MMKIGVDARLLSRPLTGVGRYTLAMCQALSRQQKITLYLYSPEPLLKEVSRFLPSAQCREGKVCNKLLRQLWCETKMPIWARKDKVDVFWGPSHRLPLFLGKSIPMVVTIHDLVWRHAAKTMRKLSYYLDRYMMPLAIRRADKVLAVSRSTAVDINREFDVVQDCLSVISPASNFSKVVVSNQALLRLDISRPYFLFVGTLEPRKNLQRLLAAYASLPARLKNQAMFVVAGGEGWGDVDLKKDIERLGLAGDVRLLGAVTQQTLGQLYSGALFLAMPSLYEGFGLPIVEAMSCGTPVLVADNSSMPEVAGKAGILVAADCVDSIAQGLRKLMSDEKIRKELARQTKKSVARYSWEKSANQMIAMFKTVIDTHVQGVNQ